MEVNRGKEGLKSVVEVEDFSIARAEASPLDTYYSFF